MEPQFSICIPNFNYQQYVGLTLESVVKQSLPNYEVVITDNASTDKSVEIISEYVSEHPNIKLKENPTNIGFAGNLDEVGRMAKGDWMIMLSSDDVMQKNALEVYHQFITLIPEVQKFAFCSAFEKIDSDGNFIEFLNATKSSVWEEKDIDAVLSKQMGITVYKVTSAEMLRRCLTKFLNPFNFAATCYTKQVYQKVGGYGGGRLYNPDKWFHWKIMAELDYVYYIDAPLFQYRWHQNNQANQQQKNQVIKYWMDEYRNCFEVSNMMLEKSTMSIDAVKNSFVRHCIFPFSFAHWKSGNVELAKRIFYFGMSCYPEQMKKSSYYYPVKLLLTFGFVGKLISTIK